MASIIQDVARSKILKKYAMILKLLQIAIVVAQLINDYRKCKSLLENILLLLSLIGQNFGPRQEIPLPLLKMPRDVIKHFLRGMFDGDGMSTHKDIKYSSTSYKLIKTLQTLLLNFGIVSHVRKETQRTSESSIIPNKNHICEIYNLKIYSDYALKFYDEIGFGLERKQKNNTHLRHKKLNSRYVNVTKEEIFDLLNRHKQPKYKNRYLDRFWGSKFERLSYYCLNKLSETIGDDFLITELYKQVQRNNKFYVDEIIGIIESEDYTYDLHVPITNSFISNGIISHNTGGRATLISCVTKDTFVYTEKGIKQVSDFIDETKNITEPYIIKPLSIMGKDRIRRTNIMVNNGIQKTIKLTSKSSNLECSETHLIWGFSNKLKKYGWLNSKYLEVGDYINIQSGFNIWGDNDKINHEYIFSNKERKPEIIYDTITKDLSYLIGMYIAEGSTYKKYNDKNELIGINITLTCGDDLSKIITNCGFKYSCWDGLHYTISSKYLGSFGTNLFSYFVAQI
jgi:intein/homing endonuclease